SARIVSEVARARVAARLVPHTASSAAMRVTLQSVTRESGNAPKRWVVMTPSYPALLMRSKTGGERRHAGWPPNSTCGDMRDWCGLAKPGFRQPERTLVRG